MSIVSLVLAGASLLSTSSAPDKREKQLDEKHCATSYARLRKNIELNGRPGGPGAPWRDYNPKMLGIRGNDMLGDIYYRGCAAANLPPDKEQAAIWYQYGALDHLPESQWKLGKMFYEGDGIPKDEKAGLTWLTSAAIEGEAEASKYLERIGALVPRMVVPNSYTSAAMAAKGQLEAAQTAERAKVVQDLSGLLYAVTTMYAAGQASRATQPRINAQPVSKPVTPVVPAHEPPKMTTPVYCNYYSSAYASEVTNTVTVTVSQFCN